MGNGYTMANPPTKSNQGFYFENLSNTNIINVNVTINEGTQEKIIVYVVQSEGVPPTTWLADITPLPSGTIFSGTFNIPCSVPPGGALIINTTNQSSGSVTFNSATFEVAPIFQPKVPVVIPTPEVSIYQVQNNYYKNALITGNGAPMATSVSATNQGFYLENDSNYPIELVNLSISEATQEPIILYVIPAEGVVAKTWLPSIVPPQNGSYYSTTQDVSVNIPPGGALIVDTVNQVNGSVTFNTVSFTVNQNS